MSPPGCRDDLILRNNAIRTVPLEGTILYSSATAFRQMIDAYRADGDGFLAKGDFVNACASYWYALGWMDAGIFIGLISEPFSGREPDFKEITVTEPVTGPLQEKTSRYRSLLGRALESLDAAPEKDSSLCGAAEAIFRVAESCHEQGRLLEEQGTMEGALGAYSYGFAWLDAGVRFGLFRVAENRELFTI